MSEAKTEKFVISAPSTGSTATVTIDAFVSTTTSPVVDRGTVARVERDREEELRRIEAAVFTHIQALRALGKTSVNTSEIAEALSILRQDVERAVAALELKGVRRIA